MEKQYQYLSFDCYGTLIDWERGILDFFQNLFIGSGKNFDEVDILKTYAAFESEEEHGEFKPYKEILRRVLERFSDKYGLNIDEEKRYDLGDSIKNWLPFNDTAQALSLLQEKYKLVIISNIDDDLFAYSQAHMGIKFDHVFTAHQMKSYKPNLNNFLYVKNALGLNQTNWLHVAQSLYHDLNPTQHLGIDSIWIKRKSIVGDQGVAPVIDYVPRMKFSNMKDFSYFMLR